MRRASVGLCERLERRTLLSFTFESAFAIGNHGEDKSQAVDVDESGNVFHMAWFDSGQVDVDPGPGSANVGVGHEDRGVLGTYLSKVDSAGKFAWGFQLFPNDAGRTFGTGLSHDAAGNIYASGSIVKDNIARIFLSKFSPSGEELWSNISSSTKSGFRYFVASDAAGSAFITGWFDGSLDLDNNGTVDLVGDDAEVDGFVAKVSSNGSVEWAKSLRGIDNNTFVSPKAIAVDSLGNVLTTGWFDQRVDFDPGPAEAIASTEHSIATYVLKLDGSGNFKWVRTTESMGTTIDVDAAGDILTAGNFYGTGDFDSGARKRLVPSPPPGQAGPGAVLSRGYISKLTS